MRNRLLVVDGESRSLRVLDVSLRGAGFDVQTAGDAAQAWSLFERSPPDLIICDTDGGAVDGFALCARVRGTDAGAQLPFLLLSASRSREQKIRALEAGADDFLIKPAYLKEVLTRVRALLHRRERDALATGGGLDGATVANPRSEPPVPNGATPFSGDLADISVVDLVQLIEHNGRSGIIHLRGPTGGAAFVYFRGGKVIDAEAGRLSGIEALARLFAWTSGTFDIEWKSIRRKDVLHRVPSELVLEGMQRLDAWNELRGQLGDADAVFEVNYRLLAERLAEIPDEVNGVLRLCDGVRTVLQVVEESAMPDTEALTTLLRLREEGIVSERGPLAAEAGAPLERWPGAASAPRATTASGPHRRGDVGSGSVRQSTADRFNVEGDPHVPPPAPPRRTAPGLGQHTPLGETEPTEPDEIRRNEPGAEADNIIQFPAPLQAEAPVPLAGRADPTLVGFLPVTAAGAPAAEVRPDLGPAALPASAETNPLSMTLPLGRAQEVAELRDQLLRERGAVDSITSSDAAEEAAPRGAASMADTHRGLGLAPAESVRALSPAAGVPVEVLESRSGASAPLESVPVATRAVSGSPGEQAGSSGGVRVPVAKNHASGPALARESGAGEVTARAPSVDRAAPRPGDATAKVTFADHDINRRDALDELGMPSRWRGFRVMVGAVVLGVGAAIAASRFLGPRESPDEAVASTAGPASAEPTPQAAVAPPASAAIVVPRAETLPSPSPSAPPAVELPAPPAPPGEGHEKAFAEAPPASAPVPPEAGSAKSQAAAATPRVSAEAPVPAKASPEASGSSEGTAGKTESGSGASVAAGAGEAARPAGAKELSDCRAAFARNRWREALTACTAAAAANPKSAVALTILAHTELNRGRLARANELAEKAVAIDPNQADAYVIIGGVHQDSGENREAKAAYRRYLELAPRGRYADELRSIVNGL